MKEIELLSTYQVGEGQVKLTVTVGDAQIGSSVVKLDGKMLGSGDIKNLIIGKGPAIIDKTLFVKSIVSDVNDKTNNVSIKYTLSGGLAPQQFVTKGVVDNDGDVVLFRAQFKFQ
jgi:hypothetical protein